MNPSRSSQSRGASRGRGRNLDYGNQASTLLQSSKHSQQPPTQHRPQTSNQQYPQQHQLSNQPIQQQQHQQYPQQHQIPQHCLPPTQTFNQQYSQQPQYSSQHYSQQPQYSNPYVEPFTQYDTHPRSPQTPTHIPIFVEEEEDYEGEAEAEAEDDCDDGKGKSYSVEEERCLARAFVRGTDNAEHGRDQKSGKYWKDIENLYNEEARAKKLPKRNWKSLKNKMVRVRYEVNRWFRAVRFVESGRAGGDSGWNEVKKMVEVNKEFEKSNITYKHAPFKFPHMLESLSKCSKFNYVTTGSAELGENWDSWAAEEQTPRLSVNASNESVGEFHSGDKRSRYSVDEVNSPEHPARPIGNKAAKRAAKGKDKVGEGSSDAANREAIRLDRTLFLQEDLVFQKQAHSEIMEVMQRAVLLEEKKAIVAEKNAIVAEKNAIVQLRRSKAELRKSKIEERKIQIEAERVERENEVQIMSMDVSHMTERQQARIFEMRDAILEKWGIPK